MKRDSTEASSERTPSAPSPEDAASSDGADAAPPQPVVDAPGSPGPNRAPATRSGADRAIFVGTLILCSVGLAVAAELTHVHVQAHLNPTAVSFCAFSETVNCDTVAREVAYSVFLQVPVSVWGVVGYLAMGLASVWGCAGRRRPAATGVLALLAGLSTMTSVVLASISAFVIRSVCILCLGTYIINAVLAVLVVVLLRRQGAAASLRAIRDWVGDNWNVALTVTAVGVSVVGLLIGFFPRYWLKPAYATLPAAADAARKQMTLAGIPTGITPDGHHWIGASQPALTIEEFSDYQCPFCSRAHAELRALVQQHATKIRLVHRHFPLDQSCNPLIQKPFHPAACYYAAMAACAGEKGKFWQANDYLFQHGHGDQLLKTTALAAEVGVEAAELEACLKTQAARLLRSDLETGVKLQIAGTPTFRVNDEVYMGQLPADLLAPYGVPVASSAPVP